MANKQINTGDTQVAVKASWMQKFVLYMVKVGNKIPHPLTIFIILIGGLFIISHFTQGIAIKIPGTEDVVVTRSLATREFITAFLRDIPINFSNFPALRYPLIIIFGTALCEYTGLFNAVMKKFFMNLSNSLIALVVIIVSFNGNLASDSAFVFLPTLAGVIYAAKGRNPILGIATSYACINGGWSAAFLFSSNEAILTGITESVLPVLPIIKDYPANIAMTWFFMIASCILLTPIAYFISEKVIAPIVEKNDEFKIDEDLDFSVSDEFQDLTPLQNKGLRNAGLALLGFLVVLGIFTFPSGAILRNPITDTILPNSPFMDSMVLLITILFFIPGIVYGITVGKIKKDRDVTTYMTRGLATMSAYLVIVFGAAQFVAAFGHTNLATLMAIKGTEIMQNLNLTGLPLIILFTFFISFLNLFIVGAGGKWAAVAPIFIPMFALLGYTPAFAQALYSIGNSVTNIITPLSSGLAVVLGILSRYKKDTGIGTIISLMIPFSVVFTIFWTILAIIFVVFNLPLGPGAGIFL